MSSSVPLVSAVLCGDETIDTPYGEVELQHSFPTDASARILFDAMDFQRASQAYVWSTPLVSLKVWQLEMDRVYGTGVLGTFATFETLREKRGIVTANLTTPYILQFVDLSDGPIVIDYPAGATASGLLDAWQRPVVDMGLTGPDQGNGGRYVLLGPHEQVADHQGSGDHVYVSPTYFAFIGIRILSTDPADATAFHQAIKMGRLGHPLGGCTFNEGVDIEWSATAYRGLDYWRALHAVIDSEPVREQDKVWIAMLEPLGIVKGMPFEPDPRQARILTEGAAFGELLAKNLQVNPRFAKPYWPGTSWFKSFDFSVEQSTETRIELDERATWFYEAVTSSKGMVTPEVGKGQVYMTTKRDQNGDLLRADATYRLRVPAEVPVAQFWGVTLYSENTRRPYDNGLDDITAVNLDSRTDRLQRNEDGSVDIYIGREAPDGMETNFMRTLDTDGWFVYFRLYAPLERFFDKTFALPDFERI